VQAGHDSLDLGEQAHEHRGLKGLLPKHPANIFQGDPEVLQEGLAFVHLWIVPDSKSVQTSKKIRKQIVDSSFLFV